MLSPLQLACYGLRKKKVATYCLIETSVEKTELKIEGLNMAVLKLNTEKSSVGVHGFRICSTKRAVLYGKNRVLFLQ